MYSLCCGYKFQTNKCNKYEITNTLILRAMAILV